MKKIILIAISALCLVSICIYKSVLYNPHHITIRTEEISSEKIDSSLNDLKLVYFTDIHFGEYTTEKDVNECVELINKLDPDIVVFGGDLIDSYSLKYITQDQKQFLTNSLKKINASQGKYYLFGNHDLDTDVIKEDVEGILTSANFFPLINTNYKIYNGTNSHINIVGIDSLLKGTPNTNEAFNDVDSSNYTLTFIHCPDLFNTLPLEKTDYVIAGHSHGGQIYIPLIDMLYRSSGAKSYFHGKHNKNATTLDISNGVGLTNYSIRFQANAEIVFYKFKSK